MKRTIFIQVAILLLAGTSSPAVAHARPNSSQITPFNLTYLAYQGYFKNQGIPAAGALIDSIVPHKITAQDLIRAAIKTHLLSEQTLSDRDYIYNLESQMQGLTGS